MKKREKTTIYQLMKYINKWYLNSNLQLERATLKKIKYMNRNQGEKSVNSLRTTPKK